MVPWNDFESVTGVKENVIFDGGSAVKPSRNSSGHETDLSGRGIVAQSNPSASKSERLLINTLSTAGSTELIGALHMTFPLGGQWFMHILRFSPATLLLRISFLSHTKVIYEVYCFLDQ